MNHGNRLVSHYSHQQMSQFRRRISVAFLHILVGKYRDRQKCMQILLSRTQAGPGRTGKQEQEQINFSQPRTNTLADLCTYNSAEYRTAKKRRRLGCVLSHPRFLLPRSELTQRSLRLFFLHVQRWAKRRALGCENFMPALPGCCLAIQVHS